MPLFQRAAQDRAETNKQWTRTTGRWILLLGLAGVLAGRWVPQAMAALPDGWQQLTAEGLADLAERTDLSAEDRTTLANQVYTQLLQNQAAAAAVSKPTLFRLSKAVGGDLSDAQRQAVVQNLGNLYSGDARAVAAMSPAEVLGLRQAMHELRVGLSAAPVYAQWIGASDAWKQADVDQLADMLCLLSIEGSPSSLTARDPLRQQAIGNFLNNETALAVAKNKWQLFRMGVICSEGMDAAQKQQLAGSLSKLYVENATALAKLTVPELKELRFALIGTGGNSVRPYVRWMAATDAWKQVRDADQLCELIFMLSLEDSAEARQALAAVSAQACSTMLLDETALAKAADKWLLFRVAWLSSSSLSSAQKQQLVARLNKLYVQDALALSKLTSGQVLELRWAMWNLEAPVDTGAAAVVAWIKSGPQWQESTAGQLAELMRTLGTSKLNEASGLLGQLAAYAWQKYTSNAAYLAKVDADELIALSTVSSGGLTAEQKQALLQTLRQRFLATPDVMANMPIRQFVRLRQAFECLSAPAVDRARLAVAWAGGNGRYEPSMRGGGSAALYHSDYWPYWSSIDKLASEKEQLLLIREKLVDGQGQVRLGASAMLACAYAWEFKDLATYAQYLEQKAADPASSADQKVQWLLARAYLAEMTYDPPAPLAGKKWVDQALAAAQNEGMRLLCVKWLVGRYVGVDEFEKAKGLLESVEGQFAAAESKTAIAQMKQEMASAAALAVVRVSQQQKQVAIDRLKGELQFLQERLAEAQKRNRPAGDVASIQRVIDQVSQELAKVNQ
jgi:hypothetical protein